MKNKRAMFTSYSDEWNTPESLFNRLYKEFHFDFDPCPPDPERDGLSISWGQRNFINPPYSNWQEWVKKGYEEYKKGKLCVFLLAARTDTKAFHEIILPYAKEIRFIKGRLKFSEHRNSAPFPSMIVIFSHTRPCSKGETKALKAKIAELDFVTKEQRKEE